MQQNDKGEYSFSTCWNIKRHQVGKAMIQEIRELGFRRVELNYNVTKEMLTSIEPMIERGRLVFPVCITHFLMCRTRITVQTRYCSDSRTKRSVKRPLNCLSVPQNMPIVTVLRLLLYTRVRYLSRKVSARSLLSCITTREGFT